MRSVARHCFGDLAAPAVDGTAAGKLDLELAKREISRSTHNNVQIVLCSVLRFAKNRGYLSEAPKGLPRLKRIEQSLLEIPSEEEVEKILAAACESIDGASL